VAIPVVDAIVAIEVDDDDHVPPETALLNAILAPTQTEVPPVIAGSAGFTVTSLFEEQPALVR